MSNNPSSKTVAVAFRLPVEVYEIAERRAIKAGISTGEYLKKRACYDLARKHGK